MANDGASFLFVTSLRHPSQMARPEVAYGLLRQSLNHLLGQTHGDYRVVVVSNGPPQFFHPKLDWVRVDFPRPALGHPQDNLRWDRGTKVLAGLVHGEKYRPQYVMPFDYDDWIHPGIVEFVLGEPSAPGWFFPRGFVKEGSRGIVGELGDFHLACGSSHVLRRDLLEVPSVSLDRSSQESLAAAVSQDYLLYILGAHRFHRAYYRTRGFELRPLPFPGAVWVRGSGENRRNDPRALRPVENVETLVRAFGAVPAAFPSYHRTRRRVPVLSRLGELWESGLLRWSLRGVRGTVLVVSRHLRRWPVGLAPETRVHWFAPGVRRPEGPSHVRIHEEAFRGWYAEMPPVDRVIVLRRPAGLSPLQRARFRSWLKRGERPLPLSIQPLTEGIGG